MIKLEKMPLGPMQTNCYVVACTETNEAAVIDPSAEGEAIVQQVRDAGLTVTHILLTHAHFDHVGALGYVKGVYPDVPIYGHPDGDEMLAHAAVQAQMFGMRIPQPPPVDEHIAEGDTVEVGHLSLQILDTPGHAPGHISFYIASAEVVFGGDALFQGSIGRTDLPGGDMKTLLNAIRTKLLTLPDGVRVYSGHGPVTTIDAEKNLNPFLQ